MVKVEKTWVVDRHIPVATIFALALQTAAIVWWAAGMAQRVQELEAKVSGMTGYSDRLTRMETRLDGLKEGVAEIKGMLQVRGTGSGVDPYRPALTR